MHAKQLEYLGPYSVWPIWQIETPQSGKITFTITDTLFIACLSPHAADIVILLDTYDKRVRNITQTRGVPSL